MDLLIVPAEFRPGNIDSLHNIFHADRKRYTGDFEMTDKLHLKMMNHAFVNDVQLDKLTIVNFCQPWRQYFCMVHKINIMNQAISTFIKIFSISTIRYFTIAGIPFLICYKFLGGYFKNAKIQNRLASNKDFLREITHSVQSSAVFSVYGYIILFTSFRQVTLVYDEISMYQLWYVPISLLIAFVIHDTYFYWMHRLLHHKLIFKHTHVVHHQSANPSPWASYSFHFFEAWTEGAILPIIVMIIPLHPTTIILFTVGGFTINVYGHLGYEILPKRFRNSFLFEVFNSSVYHNLHHSKFKGNYGLYFRVWDRLLKTEHPNYVREYDRLQEQRFGKE